MKLLKLFCLLFCRDALWRIWEKCLCFASVGLILYARVAKICNFLWPENVNWKVTAK
jgi:hypothetical protein